MKKNDFTGWKTIFDFTFRQSFKSKSSIISTVIFAVICIATFPVMSLIAGNKEVKESSIKEVKIINYTDVDLVDAIKTTMSENKKYKNIQYTTVSENDEKSLEEELKMAKSDCKYIMMVFSLDEEMGYKASLKYGDKSSVDKTDLEEFASDMNAEFAGIMAKSVGVSKETLDLINKDTTTKVTTNATKELFEEKKDTKENGISMGQYGVLLFMMTITVFMISLSGEGVSGTIVTEKSSKIVEVLLTSVRPMAIITGKVLAVFCVSVIEIAIMAVSLFMSYVVNGKVIPTNLKGVFSTDVFAGLSVVNIVISVLVLLAGIMFYEVLAGLVGSTVNKIEEMAEGMKAYQMTMVLSSYVTIALAIVCMSGAYPKTLVAVACIFPLTAPFCLPGFLMLGKLSVAVSIIAVLAMLVFLFMLLLFTSNVYEEVIYHNGERMKIKEVIGLYRTNVRKAGADSEK